MLVIRQAQMRRFHDIVLYRWLEEYLTACYPVKVQQLGRAEIRSFLQPAVRQARVRRFEGDLAIRKYVHVAFLLGLDFEKDPALDWALRILEDPRFKDPLARLRALEDAVVHHLAQRSGTV